MRIVLFTLYFSAFALSACTFNKKEQDKGINFLQGKWSEGAVENKEQLVSYQKHDFTFTCDSFYLQVKSFAKVNLNGGPCYDKNSWKEYAKGYYKLVGDTLKLEGNFVSEHYKFKAENSCYRVGKYQENFVVIEKANDLITIKSLQTSLTHQLMLKQKLRCKPQI